MNSEQIFEFQPTNIANSVNILFDSTNNKNHNLKQIYLLNQKRKRENENNINFELNIIKSKQKRIQEKSLSQKNNNENYKQEQNIKTTIYDIPSNIFIIIFSFLNIDQIFLLKNIGVKNVKQAVLNLLEYISENKKNYFSLTNIKVNNRFLKQMELIKDDSDNCKNYFWENKFKGEILPTNPNIKYALYNPETNKNYFLFRHINYIFCSADINSVELDEEFKLENEIYEKFQFISLSNNQKIVVFFSIRKISIYDLMSNSKIVSFYTQSVCWNFLLYNKELNIFILPCYNKSVNFYGINYKNSKKKFISLKNNFKHNKENIEIFDIGKIIQKKIIKYLLCVYSKDENSNSDLIIYNYKDFVVEKEIQNLDTIININTNNEYLLVYMKNGKLNYYELTNDGYNFDGFFDFNILCNNINEIKHVSLIDYKILNNVFIVLKKSTDENKIKACLLNIEKYKNKKGFNYMVYPLNFLESDFLENGLINSKFTEEKINGKTVIKMTLYLYNFNNDNISKRKKRVKSYLSDGKIESLIEISAKIPLNIKFN